jgi:hypothetical protein
MELQQQLAYYKAILLEKLVRVQEKEETVEVIMLMTLGILNGLWNPNQIAEQLEIAPKQLYEQLHQMSAHSWRGLLKRMMMDKAVEKLKEYESSSASTKSRQEASLCIDDSLVKRLGEALSYVWPWYSGQYRQVRKGQDLLGIVLRINGEILPLSLVWVSKQGRASTNKPDLLVKEMESLKEAFLEHSIDITHLGVSLDSWWLGDAFSERLSNIEFTKQVITGKNNLLLKVGRKEQSFAEHFFEKKLETGWAHPLPARRLKGKNPTLGDVVIVFFDKPRSKVFALVVPARPLRTCEALRIWENHQAVETFWKRMKQWLGLGKMQLQGRKGAWADLTLRVLAYLFALPLLGPDAPSLAKLSGWLRRKATFAQLIYEHFQPFFPVTYAFYHS